MKRASIAAVLALALSGSMAAPAASVRASELAARTELYAIPTLTLSDSHFLKGEAEGTPATVGGQFRIAPGTVGCRSWC